MSKIDEENKTIDVKIRCLREKVKELKQLVAKLLEKYRK